VARGRQDKGGTLARARKTRNGLDSELVGDKRTVDLSGGVSFEGARDAGAARGSVPLPAKRSGTCRQLSGCQVEGASERSFLLEFPNRSHRPESVV